MLSDSRPGRAARGAAHIPPPWVDPGATFFLTINCQQRGRPQLTVGETPRLLFESVSFLHERRRWWPGIFLLMPDHLHTLVVFPSDGGRGINRTVGDWKRYTARAFGVRWQRDFFDHRIRSDADHQHKWAYIRDNPVRQGLVERHDEWPHVWFPDRIGWP